LRFGLDQCLDLASHQVLLVRPELHLPGAVAFGQRADRQGLQAGPGALGGEKHLARAGQVFLAGAERLGAAGQGDIRLFPGGVGW